MRLLCAVNVDTHSLSPHDDTDCTRMLLSGKQDPRRRDHCLLDISIIAVSARSCPSLQIRCASAVNLDLDVKLNRTFLL